MTKSFGLSCFIDLNPVNDQELLFVLVDRFELRKSKGTLVFLGYEGETKSLFGGTEEVGTKRIGKVQNAIYSHKSKREQDADTLRKSGKSATSSTNAAQRRRPTPRSRQSNTFFKL